jgi:hypothetical protein
MNEDEIFKLKVQLTNEYLRSGGTQKIEDPYLLQDIIDFDESRPETITSRMRAFMNLQLNIHSRPPFFSEQSVSEYKSLVQKSFCFDQYTIDTKEEFDEIYEKYKMSKDILFRGQREASWRLYNRLQRQWIIDKLYEKGYSYQELLSKFVIDGKANFEEMILGILDVHHIDVINNISVLGFLQHHGCPTPLLDWTYKFQTALYFGLDKLEENAGPREIDNYFSVYFINQKDMEGGGMRQVMDDSLDVLDEEHSAEMIAKYAKDEAQRIEMTEHFKGRKIFDKDRIPGSGMIEYVTRVEHMVEFPLSFFSDKDANTGFIFSLNNSKNILNQSGVFVWNASPSKPLEVVGAELYFADKENANPDEYRFCECFNINKELAPYIMQRLTEDGITKDFIYPTHDIDTWGVYEKNI